MDMQQQQPQTMIRPVNLTTEQIQKCLEENKELILAILENHNLGKLAECALYQARLQENLTYLAGVADCQQQASTSLQLDNCLIPSQAAMSQQQSGSFVPKVPFNLGDQQQQQPLLVQQQHLIQGQMGMRPGDPNRSFQGMRPGDPNRSFQGMQTIHDGNFMYIHRSEQYGTGFASRDGMGHFSSYGHNFADGDAQS